MSASYDQESTADLDWVRAQLGDVEDPSSDDDFEDYAVVTDERITFVLEQWPDQRNMAVAQLAHELVTRFAQDPVRVTVAGLFVDYSERIKAWSNLAAPYLAWFQKQAAKTSTGSSTPVKPITAFGLARGRRG